jgi:hypothetical protein
MQLLSEEIYDFSRGEMTEQKIKELKGWLNRYIYLHLHLLLLAFILYAFMISVPRP